MKKLIFWTAVILLLSSLSVAQGTRVGSDATPIWTTSTIGNVAALTPVPSVKISFCNHPANAVPCTNYVTTYTDVTLGTPCSNSTQIVLSGTSSCVANADVNGNWGVYVSPALLFDYTTTTAAGVSSGPFIVNGGTLLNTLLSSNNVWTGTNSFNAILALNTTQYAQANADIGISISACIAALPSTGGTCDASLLTGPQTCTTNITIGGATKPVRLLVPQGAQWSGACKLTIAGSFSGIEGSTGVGRVDTDPTTGAQWVSTLTSGNFITINPAIRGPFLRNLDLVGTRTASTSVGICAAGAAGGSAGGTSCSGLTGGSGTNQGIVGLEFTNLAVNNFGGNCVSLEDNVYQPKFRRYFFFNCGNYGIFGGGVQTTNFTLGQASLQQGAIEGNFGTAQGYFLSPATASVEVNITDSTIADTPSQASGNGLDFEGTTALVNLTGDHFENLGGTNAGGTPDITNAPILIGTKNGSYNISSNLFATTSAKCNGGVLRNAIAVSNTTGIGITESITTSNNAIGNYAAGGPAGTNCVFFDSSGVTVGTLAKLSSTENITSSNYNLGSHIFAFPTQPSIYTPAIGVGGAPSTAIGIDVSGSPASGTTQAAFDSLITFGSGATTGGISYQSQPATAAAAFNMVNLYHFQAIGAAAQLGAGSSVTNQYGFYVGTPFTAATNNYGFYNASAAPNNFGAGTSTFGGQIISTLAIGTAPLSITSTTPVANLTVQNHPIVEYCGATSGGVQACAKTQLTSPLIAQGDVTLNTATTQSITTLPFTNANYSCTGSDLTTTTGTVFFNTYANASVTIGENGGVNTDHLRYICVGN